LELITSGSLGSATNTFTLSSIPTTFNHLKLYLNLSIAQGRAALRFNGNTSTVYNTWAYASTDGNFFNAGGGSSTFIIPPLDAGANPIQFFTIFHYRSTVLNKKVAGAHLSPTPFGPVNQVGLIEAGWNQTAAITSIEVREVNNNNFDAGTAWSLYGLV
jgi:hypothetical protein